MAHTFTNLLTHVIFSTKDRKPYLDADLRPDVLAYVGGTVRQLKGKALIANGTSDHVHLLVSLPPFVSISDIVRIFESKCLALDSPDMGVSEKTRLAGGLRRFQREPVTRFERS